jgi:hypothetical protein
MSFAAALAKAGAGDTILLQPGTYAVAYTAGAKNTITFGKAGLDGSPITIQGDGGRAVFDFSFPEGAWVQDSVGFKVTGSYYVFRDLEVTRAGFQGVYVTGQHNTFERCAFHHNRNTGLEINKGGAYTTVVSCDAYRNYDPKKLGGMADGFGPKQTQGPGNRFVGCRAWENSDDGFDLFDSPEKVVLDGCWAFRNGLDLWNVGATFAGNGNGFKLGGNSALANHVATRSVAFGNRVKGFDQNNNTGGLTLYNNTAYGNATNFALGGALAAGEQHVLSNNVSVGAGVSVANATQAHNSWNTGFSAAASDFASVDVSGATADRNADGSLPASALFRLAPGSKLIDAGVDVGLPFSGAAPDLGAFELGN